MAKDGDLVLPAPEPGGEFAPLVMFDVEPLPLAEQSEPLTSAVEIMAGSVAVRLDGDTPAGRIAEMVLARDLSIKPGAYSDVDVAPSHTCKHVLSGSGGFPQGA